MDSEERSTQKDTSSSAVTSSPGHTPGPWNCVSDPYEDGTPYFRFTAGDPYVDGDRMGFSFTAIMREQDASLIVAATDLLDACLYIVAAGENGDEITAIEKAKAAIAKARSLPAI